MFTASGLRVRFLKVKDGQRSSQKQNINLLWPDYIFNVLQVWEKSGYNTVEWVRYITKAGSYEVRC